MAVFGIEFDHACVSLFPNFSSRLSSHTHTRTHAHMPQNEQWEARRRRTLELSCGVKLRIDSDVLPMGLSAHAGRQFLTITQNE